LAKAIRKQTDRNRYKRIATSKYKFNEWIKGYKKWKKDDER